MSSVRRFERAVTIVIFLWLAVLAAALLLGCAAGARTDDVREEMHDAGYSVSIGVHR